MKAVRAKVSTSGYLNLPMEFRKIVGLDKGGDVIVEFDGHDLRIRTVEEIIGRAQELSRRVLSGKPDVTVDDFLAERRLLPSADHPRAGWAQVAQEIAVTKNDNLTW